MKSFFRLIVFVLLVSGWTLAGSSLYVIRTDQKLVIITKNHLGFSDTYVDTRTWTLDNVRQHPALVARLLELKRPDVLATAVDNNRGSVEAQLTDAMEHPESPSTSPSVAHAATQSTKSIFDFD